MLDLERFLEIILSNFYILHRGPESSTDSFNKNFCKNIYASRPILCARDKWVGLKVFKLILFVHLTFLEGNRR